MEEEKFEEDDESHGMEDKGSAPMRGHYSKTRSTKSVTEKLLFKLNISRDII